MDKKPVDYNWYIKRKEREKKKLEENIYKLK